MDTRTREALIKYYSFFAGKPAGLPGAEDTSTPVVTTIAALAAASSAKPEEGVTPETVTTQLKAPLTQVVNDVIASQGAGLPYYLLKQLAGEDPQLSSAGGAEQGGTSGDQPAETPTVTATPDSKLRSYVNGFTICGDVSVHSEFYDACGIQSLIEKTVLQDPKDDIPEKNKPQMTYMAMLHPKLSYGQSEAEIASLVTGGIPTLEMSRCVPFFNVKITAPGLKVEGGIKSPIDSNDFLRSGLRDQELSGKSGELIITETTDTEGNKTPVIAGPPVGMELFTMPQSIVPIGQANDAFRSDSNQYGVSVDRSRPFMTIKSFSTSVVPTRGVMSTKSAKVSLTLHDRARLPDIAPIITPAMLGKVDFDVEYGWSHPDGGPTSDNVYGQLLNSMRDRSTYTVVNTGYQFTDDGQVDITLTMVTKSTTIVNELDAALTGKTRASWKYVEDAYEALKEARTDAIGILNKKLIADVGGTKYISTLSLNSTGALINDEKGKEIQAWIDQFKSGGGELADLATKLETLKAAVESANDKLSTELQAKISALRKCDINKQTIFTYAPQYQDGSKGVLYHSYEGMKSTVTTFGAILQLFMVQPLASEKLFDEVQLVTYPVNAQAGAAAGVNIGALPVDTGNIGKVKFKDLLESEYKKYGGQYPIARFVKYIANNFIEPEFSLAYGLKAGTNSGNSAYEYDAKSGKVVPKKITNLAGLEKDTAEALKKAYYESSEPDGFSPMPTPFRPIKIQIHFEAMSVDNEMAKSRLGIDGEAPGLEGGKKKTILRIHVFDASAQKSPELLDILRTLRASKSGLIIQPKDRLAAGMSKALRDLYGKFHRLEETIADLKSAGIIQNIDAKVPQVADAIKDEQANIAKLKASAAQANIAGNSKEAEALNQEAAALDARLAKLQAPGGLSDMYYLATSPQRLIEYLAGYSGYPNIVFGEEGSVVKSMSLSSNSNSKTSTIHMIRAAKQQTGVSEPERGLPLRAMPMSLSLEIIGNPLVKFMQAYFVRADTGTTIDNIYKVAGIDHEITPEMYTTKLNLVPIEAYGAFNRMPADLASAIAALGALGGESPT